MIGLKKMLSPKNFGIQEKIWGAKKIWNAKKFLFPKNFGVPKDLGNLGIKIVIGPKEYRSKKCWVQKILWSIFG